MGSSMFLPNALVSHLTPFLGFLSPTLLLNQASGSVPARKPCAASVADYLNEVLGPISEFSEGEDGWYISRKADLFTALRNIPRSEGIELIWFIPDEASESIIRKLALYQMYVVANTTEYIICATSGRRASPISLTEDGGLSEARLHPLVTLAHETFFTLVEVNFGDLCDKRAKRSCEGTYLQYPSGRTRNHSWIGTLILPTGISLITRPPFPEQQGLVLRWRPIH